MKRAFDLIVGLLLLLPAILIVGFCAVLIRLDTDGSPLFLQSRVGRDGREFRLIKLRTMRVGTAIGASHEVGASTVTRVGAALRRFKIDELPQLWSVLIGDMSLVGPRPCLPTQHELIREREAKGVYQIRPGITGLAQANGIDMSNPIRLAEVDGSYVQHRTFCGDVGILIKTLTGGGFHDAAGHLPPPD